MLQHLLAVLERLHGSGVLYSATACVLSSGGTGCKRMLEESPF